MVFADDVIMKEWLCPVLNKCKNGRGERVKVMLDKDDLTPKGIIGCPKMYDVKKRLCYARPFTTKCVYEQWAMFPRLEKRPE